MARILAITNQKGGVGKTTTTVNLAACLAELKQRVLLVDLDPQANATMGCGIDKNRLTRTVYHLLLGMAAVDAVLIPAPSCHCHIVPANRELAGAEVELVSIDDREHRLQRALQQVEADYDYILIDCPHALNLLTARCARASTRAWKSTDCCAPCSIHATPWRSRFRPSSSSISAKKSIRRSFRAMSAWPRRRAMASR
jgi:cellulose biosynthesis protein BcsQ